MKKLIEAAVIGALVSIQVAVVVALFGVAWLMATLLVGAE